MREIRLIDGIREAMQEEMRRDPNIFVYGEGIGPRGGNFNETLGMAAEFGVHRLIVNLGSQRPEKVDQRLAEIERVMRAAA